MSLCLHEFAHAYAAYRAGDRSVEAAGYLTLNPFKYAHPLLSIVLPLLFIVQGGIGLPGGAVYLHPHAFRSKAPERGGRGRPGDEPGVRRGTAGARAPPNRDDDHARFWPAWPSSVSCRSPRRC